MVAILLATCLAGPVEPPFDAALAAHTKAVRAAVTIDVSSKAGSQKLNMRYGIRYIRPHTLLLDGTNRESAGTRRTLFLSGTKLTVFDRQNNEVVRRQIEATGSLAERALSAGGRLEDAVQTVIEPKVMGNLFKRFRNLKGWRSSTAGGQAVYTFSSKNGTTRFGFDRSTRMLRQFSVSTSSGFVRWILQYGKTPTSVTYRVPASAREVAKLSAQVGPPAYADAAARKIAARAVEAYDRLRHMELELTSDGAVYHVWMSGKSLRHQGGGWDWGYDGKVLWVYDRSRGKAWRGKVGMSAIGSVLDEIGAPFDAHVRQIHLGSNPIRMMLIPGAKVKRVGALKVDGATCDILEVATPGLRISAFIRQADRLAASIESTVLDDNGRKLTGSERGIRYLAVGRVNPAGRFTSQIPSGLESRPLPKAK